MQTSSVNVMKCPFNKANNMCFAVHNSPNPCNVDCVIYKLLTVLSTMQSIDTRLADLKPEIDLEPIKMLVEATGSAIESARNVPKVDLSPVQELREEVKTLIAKDYSEDLSKLKRAVSMLATEISEIKDLVRKVQVGEIEETIMKAMQDTKVAQKLEKSVENLTSIIADLREKVPTII